MAEVTGDIGGQPVELNNAATEATLRQLLSATTALVAASAKGKKGAKLQEELEKELKRLHDQSKKLRQEQQLLTNAQKEEIEKKKKLADAAEKEKAVKEKSAKVTHAVVGGFINLSNAALGAVTSLTGLMNELATMGNSMTSAAAVFSNIPLIGNTLARVFGALAGSADRTYKTFQQTSSVGANFNANIRDMVNSAGAAGLTLEQFGAVVAKNGENLALLGGSTAEGAKRLATLGRTIRTEFRDLGDDLGRLGFTTEDINNAFARYSGMMAKAGGLQNMSNQQLIASTGEYLKNLDAVAKLTGQSKEALEQQEAARMKDAQFRVMLAKLGDDGKNLQMLLNSLPPELQEGAKEILATGTATTKAGEQFLTLMPDAARQLTSVGNEARQTGKLSREAAISASDAVKRNADALRNSPVIDTLGSFDAEMARTVVGILDLQARNGKLGEVTEEQAKQIAAAAEANKKSRDALDPASLKVFQERIAELSNKFTLLLAQNIDKLMPAFEKLISIVNDYLVPIFTKLIDNIGLIVGVFATLKAAMIAYNAVLKVQQFKESLKGTRANPMYVVDMTGGKGVVGGTGSDGGKGGKKGMSIGKVAKIGGVVGAVASGAMLVGDLSDISKKQQSGELTEAQAKEERGGAVGGAVGGAGGALAGAAAGAAIGSVVPVVGTVIGGLIGGALGSWLGSKGGETIGRAATKAQENAAPSASSTAQTATPSITKNYNDPAALAMQELRQQRSKDIDAKLKEIQKEKEDAAKAAADEKAKTTQTPVSEAAKNQEIAAKELVSLNKNIAELIKLNKSQVTINEQQLDVQRGYGNDLFVSA